MKQQRKDSSQWFRELRDIICNICEKIEEEFCIDKTLSPSYFTQKSWNRNDGGGGVMSIMRGNVFEKVGVNISTVYGKFSEQFKDKIPGASNDPRFFATGISMVAHMKSPLIPAMHFNTRYIETTKSWFGGGADLTPIYLDEEETKMFHKSFKEVCDKHNPEYYPKFKNACDNYFYLKHRNESRGVGGIFYDYLSNDFDKDFNFTRDVGNALIDILPRIVRKKICKSWSKKQREYQLFKRGRYVEFNLLHDRGTKFGLETGGDVEAIFMSMPPEVKW